MTGFVGIYSKSKTYAIPTSFKAEMQEVLSRSRDDTVDACAYPQFCLVSYDIGAFDSPSFLLSKDGSVTKIAGRAYALGNGGGGRLQDARTLTAACRINERQPLISARGSFCGIVYLKPQHRAYLFTDTLGVRPVYLTDCGPYFIFSTSLRVLTSLSCVTTRVDEVGAMQRGYLGYSLGKRTLFSNISVTFGGELIVLDSANAQCSRYFRLEDTVESTVTTSELADMFYQTFTDAVSLRCEQRCRHRSLLSGGLDSRLIVSALCETGAEVETYCMASTGQQEHAFSKLFAEAAGTRHRFIDEKDGFRHQSNRLKQYTGNQKLLGNPDNAHLLWSGDGGSVGLGFVYIDQDLEKVQRIDSAQIALLKLAEIKGSGFSRRIMRKARYKVFREKFVRDLYNAMLFDPYEEVERNLRFFYLLNDQRCHLYPSFEDVDLHRIEFVLPFFDAELLKVMASIPTHLGLRHRFYTTVMNVFPDTVRTTPWQAYPNHDPCPLPIPEDLVYQWDEGEVLTVASIRSDAAEALCRAFGMHFPPLYSRPRMMALSLLEYLGLSHRSYAFGPFLTLARATDLEKG